MAIYHNGIKINSLYHNGVKVQSVYHNGIKIYSSMYPDGHVLWQSPNDYGIALGGSHSDSPYLVSGNVLQFDFNQKLIKNGINIYVNIVNYYGYPYKGTSPLWAWSNSTIPGGYSNSYSLPTQIVEIPLSNFNAQNILYKSRGQGEQSSVYVSVNSQGVMFKSTYGGTIFDIPTYHGYSAILISKIEAY